MASQRKSKTCGTRSRSTSCTTTSAASTRRSASRLQWKRESQRTSGASQKSLSYLDGETKRPLSATEIFGNSESAQIIAELIQKKLLACPYRRPQERFSKTAHRSGEYLQTLFYRFLSASCRLLIGIQSKFHRHLRRARSLSPVQIFPLARPKI